MIYDDIRKVLLGQLPVEEFVDPFSASVLFFAITMTTGWLLRTVNKTFTPEPLRGYVASFSATMEMCAYFFENNLIFSHYGSFWLFIAVIIECFIANRTFFGASENPCQAFVEYLENRIPISTAACRIGVQALAGFASYRWARMVWSLDMVPNHRDRYIETQCGSDLNVALMTGLVIEMGATLVDTWLGRQTVSRRPVLDELIKLANGSLMIVLGINMTGMYFNPAMASGHTFGCHGTAAWEHFMVYWTGPFMGCYLAVLADRMIHVDVVETDKNKAKKLS